MVIREYGDAPHGAQSSARQVGVWRGASDAGMQGGGALMTGTGCTSSPWMASASPDNAPSLRNSLRSPKNRPIGWFFPFFLRFYRGCSVDRSCYSRLFNRYTMTGRYRWIRGTSRAGGGLLRANVEAEPRDGWNAEREPDNWRDRQAVRMDGDVARARAIFC